MILKCPACQQKEQVTPRKEEDFVQLVCDRCGKIYYASLVRAECREVKHVNNEGLE